jgi:DNA phosphorothioation-dependent restriction protein DptG
MYRIDKFLEYYNSLYDCQTEIEKGTWVNAQPLPFYYGILTKEYWKERKQRKKDAKAILKGEAIAVTWRNIE